MSMTMLWVNQWQLKPQENRIYSGQGYQDLQPRCMSLLQFLAERPGEVVSREALMDGVWQGRIVGEDALNNCVKKLRRSLNDDPRNPKVIETISKKGYRLVARVRRHRWPQGWRLAGKLALLSLLMTLTAGFYLSHDQISIYRFSDADTAAEREAKLREMTETIESSSGSVRSVSVSTK
jgi:DNA-binding winged helix-turn-helix (wHTH) protein